MSYEIKLTEILKASDEELYGRLLHIGGKAKTLLSYTQGAFPFYTPHDFFHSESVQENLEWLIPDSIKEDLNKYEIFLLLVAAWLHDWGMIGGPGEDPVLIREEHHERTEEYFNKLHDKIGLNAHEAHIAGRIARGHRKVDLYSNDYQEMIIGQGVRIRTRLLSALLRIADETDITHSRTPEVIYFTLNPTGKSDEEFKKHLSISGIGQLTEPHKIYLSAIAYDPIGAKAIRQVTKKIQTELNLVKSILSQHGIPLDTVELRLETRGFIDKPIAFEMNRENIFNLLVGQHLYAREDVALRELVQNAVDSCNVRSAREDAYKPTIDIKSDGSKLVITDNGIGMGFTEAKRFLSSIGSSYYTSQQFRDEINDQPYDPISCFGIGLLSSFLIADGLEIETKRANEEACYFTVNSLGKEWRYEKGKQTTQGTKVILHLNESGQKLNLKNVLERYFLCLDVPVSFTCGEEEQELLHSLWTKDDIICRFIPREHAPNPDKVTIVSQIEKEEYDAILVTTAWRSGNYFRKKLLLFNHGIFVNGMDSSSMSPNYCLFLNLKKSSIDLHISRENVIKNKKWSLLLQRVFNDILEKLVKETNGDNIEKAIAAIASLVDSRISYTIESEFDFFLEEPFYKSFFRNAPFLVLQDDRQQYMTLEDFMTNDCINVCRCSSIHNGHEMRLLKESGNQGPILVNPYNLPGERGRDTLNRGFKIDLVEKIAILRGKQYKQVDLRDLLLSIATFDVNDYSKIAPPNVEFASFGESKPLCVIKEYPRVSVDELSLDHGYWGNIFLFWDLLEPERNDMYRGILEAEFGKRYSEIILKTPPQVLLDSSDVFIKEILKHMDDINEASAELVNRYFRYLSFLPFVMGNLSSLLVCIESIDNLEKLISQAIGIDRPEGIFNRLAPNAHVYKRYWDTYGIKYVLEE
jgi:hypothetical protein